MFGRAKRWGRRGEAGYRRLASRRGLPFTPAPGAWTLQIDPHPAYGARPSGPVQRIRVTVG